MQCDFGNFSDSPIDIWTAAKPDNFAVGLHPSIATCFLLLHMHEECTQGHRETANYWMIDASCARACQPGVVSRCLIGRCDVIFVSGARAIRI